jgi:hypothetical protein
MSPTVTVQLATTVALTAIGAVVVVWAEAEATPSVRSAMRVIFVADENFIVVTPRSFVRETET